MPRLKILDYMVYPPTAALAVVIVGASHEADRLYRLAAQMQSLDGAARHAWANLLESLSFQLYTGASEWTAAYRDIIIQAGAARERANLAAAALGALILIHLLRLGWPRRWRSTRLAAHLNLSAALLFAIGVLAPLLTLVAYAQVPVLGEVVLNYESKSVLATVAALYAGGDFLLAAMIGISSVLFPGAKLVLLAFALGPASARQRRWALARMHALGRWSLTDVFVVAVLIAMLALGAAQTSSARAELGLYCFVAYCAMAALAAHVAAAVEAAQVAGA